MSSRFGRNKRRAARERIAELENELAQNNRQLAAAQRMLSTAREDGATVVLRAKYLSEETKRITHLLAEKYGPKLMEAAGRLVDSQRERARPPIDFRAMFDPMEPVDVITIEGFIPSFHYRVRLANF